MNEVIHAIKKRLWETKGNELPVELGLVPLFKSQFLGRLEWRMAGSQVFQARLSNLEKPISKKNVQSGHGGSLTPLIFFLQHILMRTPFLKMEFAKSGPHDGDLSFSLECSPLPIKDTHLSGIHHFLPSTTRSSLTSFRVRFFLQEFFMGQAFQFGFIIPPPLEVKLQNCRFIQGPLGC